MEDWTIGGSRCGRRGRSSLPREGDGGDGGVGGKAVEGLLEALLLGVQGGDGHL